MNAAKMTIIALASVALAQLAACRQPEDLGKVLWQQPNVDETRMLADEQDCRRRANAEVEREARRERIFSDDNLARPGSYDALMFRHDAARRTDRLAAECMRRRGYAPAPR